MVFKKFMGALTGANKAPTYEVPVATPQMEGTPASIIERMKLSEEDAAALPPMEANESSESMLGKLLVDPRFALISAKFLAFGLKPETAALWAAESATLAYAIGGSDASGAPVLSPEEAKAVDLAKAYACGDPTFSTEAAQAAAEQAGFDKPAAWAAQAAAWKDAKGAIPAADLQAKAVEGAVLLAAATTMPDVEVAIPKMPEIPELPTVEAPEAAVEAMKVLELSPPKVEPLIPSEGAEALDHAKALKPFIDQGLALASG